MSIVTWDKPHFKERGKAVLERIERRKTVRAAEEAEKRKVRHRDVTCRWPGCRHVRDGVRLEVAHLRSKGMGGDHGTRSTADRMVLLCYLHHQGPTSLHSGDLAIECESPAGAYGPLSFWQRDGNGEWFMVKRETRRGYVERD